MKLPIQTGHAIQVLVPVKERTVPCTATVLNVFGRTFYCTRPTRHGIKIPIETDQVVVTMSKLDAVYTVNCPVISHSSEGLTLGLPYEDEVQRVQRREFVRVRTMLPCTVSAEDPERPGLYQEPHATRLKDISGGGCSVMVAHAVPKGATVRLDMTLPEEGAVILFGKIVRCSPILGRKEPRYEVGVRFGSMDETLRSMLVRYVFQLQREAQLQARAKGGPGR